MVEVTKVVGISPLPLTSWPPADLSKATKRTARVPTATPAMLTALHCRHNTVLAADKMF